LRFHFGQRDRSLAAFGALRFSEFPQMGGIREMLMDRDELLVGKYGELLLSIFDQEFGTQCKDDVESS
jgi:hypothetical protein